VNGPTESHVPREEFRARLEQEVVRAFRRESRFDGGVRTFDPRRVRGLLILLAGLVLGFGTEFARGQVQTARERDQLIEVATANRQLAATRVALAEAALTRARSGFATGLISRESLLSAETDVLLLQQQIARIDLEIAEIRVSAAPPRDELWAPLVGGRDFVSERLRIEAAATQQSLSRAEQQLKDVERRQRVGTVGPGDVSSAASDVREAQRLMKLLAKRLDLRRRFLEEHLDGELIARELKRHEVATEIERTTANLQLARERAARANERMRVGTASELDVKRAELEALELSVALAQLRAESRELEKTH
jgi:outer membrane protein TolC